MNHISNHREKSPVAGTQSSTDYNNEIISAAKANKKAQVVNGSDGRCAAQSAVWVR